MPRPSRRAIVPSLLDRHGGTYAAEVGIRPLRDTPWPQFRLLCAAPGRGGHSPALSAARTSRG